MEPPNASSNAEFLSCNSPMSLPIPPPVPRESTLQPQPEVQNSPPNQNHNQNQTDAAQLLNESQSSQQQASSSTTRSLITPDDIDQDEVVKKKIHNLVSSYYSSPWLTWTEVPREDKNKIWNAFVGTYRWDQGNECRIRKRWSHVAGQWLKKHLYNARSKGKQPPDINDSIWEQLKLKWGAPEYVSKCQKNKRNRAVNSGSSECVYRGGSCLTSGHMKKMTNELEREPTQKELFVRCFGKNGVLQDDRAKEIVDKFDEAISKTQNLGDGEVDEVEVWRQTVGTKKGRIYGLGNLAPSITNSRMRSETPTQSRRNSDDQRIITQQGETINQLQSELAATRSRVDQITSALLAQGFQLPVAPEGNRPSPGTIGSEVGSDNSPA